MLLQEGPSSAQQQSPAGRTAGQLAGLAGHMLDLQTDTNRRYTDNMFGSQQQVRLILRTSLAVFNQVHDT